MCVTCIATFSCLSVCLLGVGDVTKMLYYDMIILFYGNDINLNMVMFALNKVLMI